MWIVRTGRHLVRHADGTHRIIPPSKLLPTDVVLPNELRPCTTEVRDDGIYSFKETDQTTNRWVYFRGDPKENEAALREALPALYLSFRP